MVVNPELAIPGGLCASPYTLLKEREKKAVECGSEPLKCSSKIWNHWSMV